jgi:GTP cyclohydrolase IB
MEDLQEKNPDINLKLETVGVKNITLPITLLDKKNKTQNTVANISMFADLRKDKRGIHMSRFIESLNQKRTKIYFNTKEGYSVLDDIIKKLRCEKAQMEIEAPYFIEKRSPISKKVSVLKVDIKISLTMTKQKKQKILEIRVPVTSLCPCSKEISKYGAHNQRSYVTLQLISTKFFWIEDFVDLIEKNSSSPIYPLLKREDEKYVTEKAYENPVFVEDLVRKISYVLMSKKFIKWFCVKAENMESIHDHNAFALFEWGEKDVI